MSSVAGLKSREIFPLRRDIVASSLGASDAADSVKERIRSMSYLLSGGAETLSHIQHTNSGIKMPVSEQLSLKLTSMRSMVSVVSMYLDTSWRSSLLQRLSDLLDPSEWDPDDFPPSERSFSTFLRMIIYLHPSRRPGVGLAASGNFVAAWSREDDRVVIECLDADELRWVIFRQLGEDRVSGAGRAPIHKIPDLIAPYEPEELFKDNGDKILI